MLFSLPRKRGINIAKIRGNKVTDYTGTTEPGSIAFSILCDESASEFLKSRFILNLGDSFA